MELLEMVLIKVGEEARRAHGMRRDLEIVNVLVPILANIVSGCGRRRRHEAYYKIKVRTMARIGTNGVRSQRPATSCQMAVSSVV